MIAEDFTRTGRLPGEWALLLRHPCRGQPVEFLIHKGQQVLRRRRVARFNLLQDLPDVAHGDVQDTPSPCV